MSPVVASKRFSGSELFCGSGIAEDFLTQANSELNHFEVPLWHCKMHLGGCLIHLAGGGWEKKNDQRSKAERLKGKNGRIFIVLDT